MHRYDEESKQQCTCKVKMRCLQGSKYFWHSDVRLRHSVTPLACYELLCFCIYQKTVCFSSISTDHFTTYF